MFGRFPVAHLLGIARGHEAEFRRMEFQLTEKGFIVFKPVVYDLDEYNRIGEMLDDMCLAKLQVCDICILVTPEHVGKSTTERIIQACSMNIPVFTVDEHGMFHPYPFKEGPMPSLMLDNSCGFVLRNFRSSVKAGPDEIKRRAAYIITEDGKLCAATGIHRNKEVPYHDKVDIKNRIKKYSNTIYGSPAVDSFSNPVVNKLLKEATDLFGEQSNFSDEEQSTYKMALEKNSKPLRKK